MLENLRRLVAGRRNRSADKAESSFRRSESFKRISIRKLERRSRKPPPKAQESPPAVQLIDYNQWISSMKEQEEENLKKLLRAKEVPPTPPPRRKYPSSAGSSSLEVVECDASSRADSGLSVSLGREWLDPPAMAPRSLELPRPAPEAEPRAHHSLESAPAKPRQRPLEHADSGFSFSISIPRLADFSPGGGGFFFGRRKKDSDARPRRGSARRTSRRSGRSSESGSLYRVVVNRAKIKSLRLDPMIFVPPEKRKPNTIRRTMRVQEIREYCSPKDLKETPEQEEEDEDIYECIGDSVTENGDYEDSLPISSRLSSDDDSWTDDETEDDLDYAPLVEESSSSSKQTTPVVRRRPARSRQPRYLVKPVLARAPSTLNRRNKHRKKGTRSVLHS